MRVLATIALLAALCSPIGAASRRNGRQVMRMEVRAYVRGSRLTASGTVPHEGIVAADPAVLPLGSRIRIRGAGAFDGVYTVTDTGRKIINRRIDLCVRSAAQARRFGRKTVTVQVLARGRSKEDAREKDIPPPARIR